MELAAAIAQTEAEAMQRARRGRQREQIESIIERSGHARSSRNEEDRDDEDAEGEEDADGEEIPDAEEDDGFPQPLRPRKGKERER